MLNAEQLSPPQVERNLQTQFVSSTETPAANLYMIRRWNGKSDQSIMFCDAASDILELLNNVLAILKRQIRYRVWTSENIRSVCLLYISIG